jgi:hypothetical protein
VGFAHVETDPTAAASKTSPTEGEGLPAPDVSSLTNRPTSTRPHVERATLIGHRLELHYARSLTPKQWRSIEPIEKRGIASGCSLDDHYAIVEEAMTAGVEVDRDTGWATDEWGDRPDPFKALRMHDAEAHPHGDAS